METNSYEKTAGSVAKSVIAIAIGKNLDNKPNIVGTGFGLEVPECFATCWHVAETEDTLTKLTKEELEKKYQLIDNKLRIARMTEIDIYEWQEIEEGTCFRASDKKNDVCIYRAIGVPTPPLHLSHEETYPWGNEVGVIGFPMGNLLQGNIISPLWSKTIIAGGLELKMEGGGETFRLALDSAYAGGFSGAPVFLAADGQVVGMLSSKTIESKSDQLWPSGISLAIPANLIEPVLIKTLDKTTKMIKDSLRKKYDVK